MKSKRHAHVATPELACETVRQEYFLEEQLSAFRFSLERRVRDHQKRFEFVHASLSLCQKRNHRLELLVHHAEEHRCLAQYHSR